MAGDWSDERIAVLKGLWRDGLSASQVAKALGGVSRNAVIGKVHRLGLSNRPTASAPPKAVRKPVAVRPPKPEARLAPEGVRHPLPPVVAGAVGPVLADLKPGCCKFPVGRDPGRGNMEIAMFCGAPQEEGSVYCPDHHMAAISPEDRGRLERRRAGLPVASREVDRKPRGAEWKEKASRPRTVFSMAGGY